MDLYSVIQYVLFVAVVTVLVKPLGGYMERVFPGSGPLLIAYAFQLSGLSIALLRLILMSR